MSALPVVVLVVAKAPVPGEAKTRLAAALGDRPAAEIAAAALLDTLDAVAETPVRHRVVAVTGDLTQACRAADLRCRLAQFTVIAQRGPSFGHRLANAHRDAAQVSGGLPVLQLGMDTPQVSAGLLADCARVLLRSDAVLGLARDGGWWVLGLRDAAVAACLRTVPMSHPDTGTLTLAAVRAAAGSVRLVPELTDVDTVDDVAPVRRVCAPGSRFRRITSPHGEDQVIEQQGAEDVDGEPPARRPVAKQRRRGR